MWNDFEKSPVMFFLREEKIPWIITGDFCQFQQNYRWFSGFKGWFSEIWEYFTKSPMILDNYRWFHKITSLAVFITGEFIKSPVMFSFWRKKKSQVIFKIKLFWQKITNENNRWFLKNHRWWDKNHPWFLRNNRGDFG